MVADLPPLKKEHLFSKKTCKEIENPYNIYIELGNRNKDTETEKQD